MLMCEQQEESWEKNTHVHSLNIDEILFEHTEIKTLSHQYIDGGL